MKNQANPTTTRWLVPVVQVVLPSALVTIGITASWAVSCRTVYWPFASSWIAELRVYQGLMAERPCLAGVGLPPGLLTRQSPMWTTPALCVPPITPARSLTPDVLG